MESLEIVKPQQARCKIDFSDQSGKDLRFAQLTGWDASKIKE